MPLKDRYRQMHFKYNCCTFTFPWSRKIEDQGEMVAMNEYEEEEMIKKLSYVRNDLLTPNIRRYIRKLQLRKKKREIQKFKQEINILDNYMKGHQNFIDESIMGITRRIKYDFVTCKYTDRILKPYIFQDFSVRPLWLQVHEELVSKVYLRNQSLLNKFNINYKRHPINYVYIHAGLIPAINSLAQTYFWPGINMASSLEYPEFSCVAMYKNIIVGFGFLSPGEHLNEGYISFLFVRPHWRRCGIAKFIIYHLINTCLAWDITLHVSSSNPSMLLYQQFGFKAYKVLNGFYDKYLPVYSKESRQAVFLKLER